ncbi:MAG: hypothetical protein U0230_24775 [Polyangiales bacterium]
MCDECHRFLVGGVPACVLCAREIATRKQRRVSLAVVVAILGVAASIRTFVAWRGSGGLEGGAMVVAVVFVGLAAWIASTGKVGDASVDVSERPRGEDEPPYEVDLSAANPYRATARRVVAAVVPRLSGKATALVTSGALVLAGLAVPASLELPRWIETEVLLGVVFVGLAGALALLLFRGYRVEDDHRFVVPGLPWKDVDAVGGREDEPRPLERGSKSASGCDGLSGCGDPGCSGCADFGEGGHVIFYVFSFVALICVVVLVVVGVSWLLVEVALPLLFLAFYEMMLFALRRVANDTHGCEGNALRSVGYGLYWSLIAVAPVAILTIVLHLAMGRG